MTVSFTTSKQLLQQNSYTMPSHITTSHQILHLEQLHISNYMIAYITSPSSEQTSVSFLTPSGALFREQLLRSTASLAPRIYASISNNISNNNPTYHTIRLHQQQHTINHHTISNNNRDYTASQQQLSLRG